MSKVFDPDLLLSFYSGAFFTFIILIAIARKGFKLSPGQSVVIGFGGYFTNTVLLGLPIIHRAYGDEALPAIYAIIGLHAPTLLTCGMLTMEMARRDGAPLSETLKQAGKRAITNPLLIGIVLGLLTNLSGLPLPDILNDATNMLSHAVLPAALFGLGGALNQYKLKESWGAALAASSGKLILHPMAVLFAANFIFHLPWDLTKVAVLTAAMPSGLNVYVFATYYNRSVDIAANTVLIATVGGVVTLSMWLWLLDLIKPYWG